MKAAMDFVQLVQVQLMAPALLVALILVSAPDLVSVIQATSM